jgi:hypothetical protein
MSFLDSAEFNAAMRARPNWGVIREMAEAVAPRLTPEDVNELMAICASGTLEQRDTALRFLADVVRAPIPDPRFDDQQRTALADMLESIVRTHYFDYPIGGLAVSLLWKLRPVVADAFVLGIDPSTLDAKRFDRLMNDLLRCQPPSVVDAKLEALTALPDPMGATARRRLENRGVIAPAKLAAIAAEWRHNRDRESLNRLYDVRIIHTREGDPIQPLLELLGEPQVHQDGDYRWNTDEENPIQLVLIATADGKVSGFKLT